MALIPIPHQKVFMKSIEVVAGIIEDNHKIFATQRGYGEFKGAWEFPGGKIEPGESREQALARELKEELSIDVSVGDYLCSVNHDYPNFHLLMHCFFCKIIGGKPTLLEHESAKWLGFQDFRSVEWLPADLSVIDILEKQFSTSNR